MKSVGWGFIDRSIQAAGAEAAAAEAGPGLGKSPPAQQNSGGRASHLDSEGRQPARDLRCEPQSTEAQSRSCPPPAQSVSAASAAAKDSSDNILQSDSDDASQHMNAGSLASQDPDDSMNHDSNDKDDTSLDTSLDTSQYSTIEMQINVPEGGAPFDQQNSGGGTLGLHLEEMHVQIESAGASSAVPDGEGAPVDLCLLCGSPSPSHVCNGQDDKGCEIEAAVCSLCQENSGAFTCCRIVCRSQARLSRQGRIKVCQKCREQSTNLVKCIGCKSLHCGYCSLQWGDSVKQTSQCTNCVIQRVFMQERCRAAHALHTAVFKMLSENEHSQIQKSVLTDFLKMAVMMNHSLQYLMMQFIEPTILKVLEYQQKAGIPSAISGSEAMRLQVSAKFYNPILTGALILDEEGPVAVSTTSQDKITSCQKPIVIVYFHDAGHHPLMYLIVPTLRQMLQNDVVEIHIIILHKQIEQKNQPVFVQELMKAFIAAGRWHIFPNTKKGVDNAKTLVLKLQATVFLDLVGNQNGRSKGFPALNFGKVVVHYLNVSSWLGKSQWSDAIFDNFMLAKLPEHERRERALIVSCWQPALPDFLLNLVDRKTRVRDGVLRIHVPLTLDRVGETLEWIWVILQRLPRARVYLEGFPVCNIAEILDSASQFEEDHRMSARVLRGRIKFLRRMPMLEFIPFLRRLQMDVSISGGPYPAHTGHQGSMAAGIPTLVAASDTVPGQVSQSLNNMAGLGGLNAMSWSDAVDMLLYLDSRPQILDAIEGQLDRLAVNRESIFDQERAALDLQNIAIEAFTVCAEKMKLEYISRPPSQPFLVLTRGEGGKIEQISVAQSVSIFLDIAKEVNYGPLDDMMSIAFHTTCESDIGGNKRILKDPHGRRPGKTRRRKYAGMQADSEEEQADPILILDLKIN